MKNLTTPQAVLGGLALVALAIAWSIPYSSNVITPAHAPEVQKVIICSYLNTNTCDDVLPLDGANGLLTSTVADDTKLKDMR